MIKSILHVFQLELVRYGFEVAVQKRSIDRLDTNINEIVCIRALGIAICVVTGSCEQEVAFGADPKIIDGAYASIKPKPKPFSTKNFPGLFVSRWNGLPNQQDVGNLPFLQLWTTPQLLFVSQLNSLHKINDIKVSSVPIHQNEMLLPILQKTFTQLSASDGIKIGIGQQPVAEVTGVFKDAPMVFIGQMPKGGYQPRTILPWCTQSVFAGWTSGSFVVVNSIKFATKFCNVFTRTDTSWLKRMQCNFHGKPSRKRWLFGAGVRPSCKLMRTPTSYPERVSRPMPLCPGASV